MRRGVNDSIKQDMSYGGASTEDIINGLKERRKVVQSELEKLTIMEQEAESIKKEIDNVKTSLFSLMDQALGMRIEAEGEKNRPQFTQEITGMKNQLDDEINEKLNSGVDPREVLADIEFRLNEARSLLDKIAQQIEDKRIEQQDKEFSDIQQMLKESDKDRAKEEEIERSKIEKLEAERVEAERQAKEKLRIEQEDDEFKNIQQILKESDKARDEEEQLLRQQAPTIPIQEEPRQKNQPLTQFEEPGTQVENGAVVSNEQINQDIENWNKRTSILAEDQKEYDRDFMNAYREAVDQGDDEKIAFLENFNQEISSIESDLNGEPVRSKTNRLVLALRDFEQQRELRDNKKNEGSENLVGLKDDENQPDVLQNTEEKKKPE